VRVEAESSAGGYLVLVDAWDPGWRASVDGVPAPVRRANAGFRAVEVGQGRHVVEMHYRPASVPIGFAVSCAALLAGAVAWGAGARRQAHTP
ncbi:MAG TPA: YfhO family protein, partial [Vicinamibacteria bacterium]|nr:YfhO family protein [Vicinamibacteria bacterium]